MYDRIKSFVKHTAVYSIPGIAYKGIGVITLPLYLNVLSASDFGVYGILEITIFILVEIFSLGQANSILVFSNSQEYKGKEKSVFFTILIYVFVVNFIIALILIFSGHQLFSIIDPESIFHPYFNLIVAVIFLRVINNVILNKLRADQRSTFYSITSVTKIILTLLLVVLMVGFMKLGVFGIFYAYLIAEIVSFFIPAPVLIKEIEFKFDRQLLSQSTKFGIPLIFSAIGIQLLNVSDRYILNYFTNTKTVGIYDLGYRIAGVVNMFMIMPFNLTLLPAATKMFGREGDARYYKKLMTYLCFVITWGGLTISLFSKEIITLLSKNTDFWPAYQIVPIIVLSYIFSATRNYASLGMFLTKQTKYIAVLTIFSAILNIGLNFIFIPIYGMPAAAYNTLIAFVIFHFATKIISDKYYKIEYENRKLLTILLLASFIFFVSRLIETNILALSLFIKLTIVLLFPFILHLFNFYEKIELETISKLFRKGKEVKLKNVLETLLTRKSK